MGVWYINEENVYVLRSVKGVCAWAPGSGYCARSLLRILDQKVPNICRSIIAREPPPFLGEAAPIFFFYK